MAKPSITLFPDTNLLIHCLDLNSLDWSLIGDFDTIELIVSRPVQKEIDRQKGGGNGRLARRARSAASLFKEIINAGLTPWIIRERAPRITLALAVALRPDAELDLDLSEPDDVLVGIAHAYQKQYPDKRVAVLTHDGGAMASAVSTGTDYIWLPDDWLLPPEPTKQDKELRAANAEIARLKGAEPVISLECLDPDGNPTAEIVAYFEQMEPLSADQVESFVQIAKSQFPLKTFGKQAPAKASGLALVQMFTAAAAPSELQITKYLSAYQAWEADLRTALGNIHQFYDKHRSYPVVRFRGRNEGSRNAEHPLVEFMALGDFGLCSPDDGASADRGEVLPRPPAEPVGGMIATLMNFHQHYGASSASLSGLVPFVGRDDPEEFYYRGDHEETASRLALGADRWRHGTQPMTFAAEIRPLNGKLKAGSVELSVHASNLSDKAKLVIPVTIKMVPFDTFAATLGILRGLKAVPVS